MGNRNYSNYYKNNKKMEEKKNMNETEINNENVNVNAGQESTENKDITKTQTSNNQADTSVIQDTSTLEVANTNEPTSIEPALDGISIDDKDKKEYITGEVVNCSKLRVRESDNKEANIVEILNKGAVIEICLTDSTEDFYKINTITGVSGYCMKDYISIIK